MKKLLLLLLLSISSLTHTTGMGYRCGTTFIYDNWDNGNQYQVYRSGSGYQVHGSNGYFGQAFKMGNSFFYLD